MMFKKSPFPFVVVSVLGLLISVHAICGPNKKDIQKLNNSLIFDLYMNYEATERNGNLVAIVDYFPSMEKAEFRSMNITSNVGGTNQAATFTFNEKSAIEKFSFEVNNMIYRYEFIYDGTHLTGATIAGKKKLSFAYDKKGRIHTISRESKGGTLEYNFEYIESENKANVKLFVIQVEKRSPGSRDYYVTWNNQYKLTSYCFEIYCSKNMKYTPQGDLTAYSFASVNEDNNLTTWEYSAPDEKGNWKERKSKNILFNRTIVYK